MALNKIRLLEEEQLLKAIKENGYEDIANILTNRGLNGQAFLDFQELQAIRWKLSRPQTKLLTNFIAQVKANPAILVKVGNVTRHELHKPKPSLPQVPKPTRPNPAPIPSKPLNTQTKPSPTNKPVLNTPKPLNVNLPVKGQRLPNKPVPISSKPPINNSDTKPSLRSNKIPPVASKPINSSNDTEESNFKKKLGNVLANTGGSLSLYNRAVSPSSENNPKLPKPLPSELNSTQRLPRPVPHTEINRKSKSPTPTISDSDALIHNSIKDRPALPLPRDIEDDVESPEFNQEGDPKLDYGYLSPNDIDTSYPIPSNKTFSNDRNTQNKSTFLHNKFTNIVTNNIDNDEHVEDTYEDPPVIRSARGNREALPLPAEHSSKLHPGNRKQLPLPQESPENLKKSSYTPKVTDLKNKRSITPNDNDDDDNEMNIYDHVEEERKTKNLKNVGAYSNSEATVNQNSQSNRPVSPINKKCTVNDLDNILIIDREVQSRRTNNLFGSIGRFFFTDKNKTTKPEATDSLNYENHMLKSEVAPDQTTFISIKDRPLPEIPKSEQIDTVVKKSSSVTDVRTVQKSSHPVSKSSSFTDSKRITSDSSRNVEPTNKFQNRPLPEINHDEDDDDHEEVYENVNEKNNKNKADETDLPEYENRNSIINSNSNTLQHRLSTIKPILPAELAFKLSEALKAREKVIQEHRSESKSPSRNVPTKNNFNKIPTPPSSDAEGDEPFYGNVNPDEEDPPLIKRNNKRADTPTEEEHQPFYGNVDEPDEITVSVNKSEPQSEEEPEEYIDLIFNINHEPFFRNTDRKGAKQLLRNFTDGAFLFRPSEKYFLVLTIKFNGKFYNLGIERTPNNKIRLNADTTSVSPEFGTLKSFVNYFTKEAVTFRDHDTLVEIFLNPILPADVF